jgi:hypothetical protein
MRQVKIPNNQWRPSQLVSDTIMDRHSKAVVSFYQHHAFGNTKRKVLVTWLPSPIVNSIPRYDTTGA